MTRGDTKAGAAGSRVRVAILPFPDEGIVEAVVEGGGEVAEPHEADAIVWTNPADPHALKDVVAQSPARWIQLPFAGIESFVAADALDPERTWTCTKGVYGTACAEHALALVLGAARRLHEHLQARSWRPPGLGAPEKVVRGSTAVIVGTGGIGTATARLLHALGVRVLAVNRSGKPLELAEQTVATDRLPEVLGDADYVILAAALTPETHHLFDAPMLARMRGEAWLVNVARGGLVDTDALVEALRSATIGGAALDVTDPEPLPEDHPLWTLPNVIITPHIANTWDMALPELRTLVRRNVERFTRGEILEGLVDPTLGY